MPLSEHEERMLDQIERALEADDPKFAHAVRTSDPRVHYKRRAVKAALGFLLGVALLLAGVISKIIEVGVAGFLVMLASSMWALSSWRRIGGNPAAQRPASVTPLTRRRGPRRPGRPGRPGSQRRPRRQRRPSGQGFMERMEERWRRRQEGGF